MYFANPKLQFRNLALHKIFRAKKCTKRDGEKGIEDVLLTIESKKWRQIICVDLIKDGQPK